MYTMDKLKEKRLANNYSIYDMAKMLNITGAYYSQLENKKRRLYYDLAVKLANIFNMLPDDLFYAKDE